MTPNRPSYDQDAWDDEDQTPGFERLRKQTGKAQTVKGGRRQQDKEWGRATSKFLRDRARFNKKP
jgi:hypothetical protein